MTLKEFIEKAKTDEALKANVNAAILKEVILPMAQAEGVELSNEELEAINGGTAAFFSKQRTVIPLAIF
ncbi:Nif11-like leader peptide family RiPP precursor [Parabacteroides sp.]